MKGRQNCHDKLHDECLNRELFGNLFEARVILEAWRIEYNESRPHNLLSYQTPREFPRHNETNPFAFALVLHEHPPALPADCIWPKPLLFSAGR